MYPILFEIGPLKIYSYGFMVAVAFILGAYLARLEAAKQDVEPDVIINLSLVLAISAILGARLLYVLQNLKFYIEYPGAIFMLQRGGLSFYGGLILATISAVIFLKRQRLSVIKIFDIVCPYLALGQAIGRIGCFLNGCCYGRPAENIGRHPVQLYASFNLLVIFVILRIFQDRKAKKNYFPGEVFLLYCLLYSVSRFFMEYLRGDNLPLWANLTLHQLISAVIFIVSSLIWCKYARGYSQSKQRR